MKKNWKSVKETALTSLTYLCRRRTIPVSEAIIYNISQLSDNKKPLKVAEGTIKNSFKDLSPHLSRLIPAWYATKEDVKNLQL
ncbi:hypothetical protein QQP08_009810 [Theobroma cacao]|nr:hypothetical protein QQP08_009810 [Theobroma cacao]